MNQEHLQLVDDYELLLPTAYLKTALLYLTRAHVIDDSATTGAAEPGSGADGGSGSVGGGVTWAIRIYEKLAELLSSYGRVPHFFLQKVNAGHKPALTSQPEMAHTLQAINRLRHLLQSQDVTRLEDIRLMALGSSGGDESTPLTQIVTDRRDRLHVKCRARVRDTVLNMRWIQNQLWCCLDYGVAIYSYSLDWTRDVAFNDAVTDVAQLNWQTAVLASPAGLYLSPFSGTPLVATGLKWYKTDLNYLSLSV